MAIGASWNSFTIGAERPSLGIALALGAPFLAFIATLVYRDQRREFKGLPPVVTEVPASLGPGIRVTTGIVSGSLLALGWIVAASEGLAEWAFVGGVFVLAVALGYIALTARLPDFFLDVLGARKRKPNE